MNLLRKNVLKEPSFIKLIKHLKTYIGLFLNYKLIKNMKKIIPYLLLLAFAYVNAQSKSSGEILYHFVHKTDSINKSIEKTDRFRLAFNQNFSLFKSINQEQRDSIYPIAARQSAVEFEKTGRFTMNYQGYNGGSKDLFYTDLKLNKTYLKTKFNKVDYLIVENDFINWEILNDNKVIIDKKCQKARGFFKGRNYTAWFTSEIPTAIGPLKFNGLPGAILEISDDKQDISFIAYKFLTSSNDEISIPQNLEIITKKQLKAVEKAVRDNPSLRNTGGITLKNSAMTKGVSNTKVINNPIELTE